MASTTETSLLSKLQTSDSEGIFSVFSQYLRPFSDLNNLKITKRSTKAKTDRQSSIRSLAKTFLPFINRALSILPKRLSDPSKLGGGSEQLALELFDVYWLCLDCLGSLASELSCKPYSVHVQKVRLLHCLEAWGRYKEAEAEGYRILEDFKTIDAGGKSVKCEGRFLPDLEKWRADKEFVCLVLEIVVTLVKCVSMGRSMNDDDYRKVLLLVEEVRSWFRVLDANTYEKLHRVLVTCLGRCTLFLVGKLTCFDGDLGQAFCFTTMAEYAKSSMKDQVYKFAHKICSSLFSLQENRFSAIIDMLIFMLDSLAGECKVEDENNEIQFVELVAYCANKCQTTNTHFCSNIEAHLHKIADKDTFSFDSEDLCHGLHFSDCNIKSRSGDLKYTGGVIKFLQGNIDILQNLSTLLGSLRSFFHTGCDENYVSSRIDSKDSVGQVRSVFICDCEASMSWTKENGKGYLLSYLNALKFLCLPLAELVNSERKKILSENEAGSISNGICNIQEAFCQFYGVFFFYKRCKCTYEGEKYGFDENSMLAVSVAAFILSIRTRHKMEKSVGILNDIICSEWIQPHGLRYLFASLYNIGVVLHRSNQVKEASTALKLSCRASWTGVIHLCEMFEHKSKGLDGDLTEDAVIDFVNESCSKTAFLLEVLHQHDSHKVETTIAESLEKWSVAANTFRRLPGPMSLVKQWVKIQCKLCKNVNGDDIAQTLYCVLSSSEKISQRTIGIILEEELLAYEEMHALYPKLCQKMQMKIIVYLLQDVYVTSDSWLQKSRILVRKGRMLRCYGNDGLKDCIQCLTEAITLLETCGKTCSSGVPPSHQLAVVYCLRGLCSQEFEPNSKRIFEDITSALNLWLSISTSDHFSADDMFFTMSENVMLLVYNIIDLMSMKGFLEFHHDIYRLIIRLFQWKNIPLEKCLMVLWECRRISHALCISPVNEAFITSLYDHYGEHTKSIDFWISCLKGSQPLMVGLQHNFSSLFANFNRCSHNREGSFRPDITVDEVQEAAMELISSAPVSSRSAFIAGYLLYDLSEKLISNGQLIKALFYAKEAHRLRTKLFQEKFMYSVEQQAEKCNETGDNLQKFTYTLQNLQVRRSVVSEVWSFDSVSWDLENCYLSPWNVLQCYLESTLQVGIVHELIGSGTEAETLFIWGKDISCSQSLPLFMVSFSSVLGKLYCRKKHWDLAERELHRAKQYLVASSTNISCLKCRLMMEVTVDHHLGDLSQSMIDSANGNISLERLFQAEDLYKSALDKLTLSDWKNYVSCPEESSADSMVLGNTTIKDVRNGTCHTLSQSEDQLDTKKCKKEGKKCRKTRNAPKPLLKDQGPILQNNLRSTRSKSRSSQNQSISGSDEIQVGQTKHSKGNSECDYSDTFSQEDLLMKMRSCKVAFGGEEMCVCQKMRCWLCLPMEVMKCGLIKNFIDMKWEFVRRRLSLRLLTSLGNCLENHGQIHETHEIILQSISILVSRNPFSLTTSHVELTSFLDLIGKEISGDVFSIERAELLYNISWLSLSSLRSRDTRSVCCDLSCIQLPKLVTWLILAFVLCREVPMLSQKVSRLLAVVFLLSSSSELCSFSSSCKALSENHWASYFHQASLGTHLNYQFFTTNSGTAKFQHLVDSEGSCGTGSTFVGAEIQNLLRVAPESVQDLEEFVEKFFAGFPCTTVVCISFLGGPYASLLQEMLLYPSCVRAWMLVSRLNSKNQPIVLLLPLDSILEDDAVLSGSSSFPHSKDLGGQWQCPWGSSVVDDVAPEFKLILEDNYLSSSMFPIEDTAENRTMWWMRRKKLDHRLGKLLRNLEDLWLGPWKYILLGECSSCERLDLVRKKLMHDLKSKSKMDVNESLLKVILSFPKSAFEEGGYISQLCLRNGCYIGRVEVCEKDKCWLSSSEANGAEELSEMAFQLICEALDELEGLDCVNREPIVLVLDFEIQMLPWENIPILRNQEVYRMPSVGSISATLDRRRHHQEPVGTSAAAFPYIDPLDAFYLLNPSGDLRSTQIEFENWFRDQKLEGKAGFAPAAAELAVALKSHDLFIYFGHGSGVQYIPRHEIQKLENCAATLLMGCSSGSLTLNGCYVPQGTPLAYLQAGSPVIVANLWEVTDKDIDRFGKAMLDSWLKERLSPDTGCVQCNLLEQFDSMALKTSNGNAKKKNTRKKQPQVCEKGSIKNCCEHRPKIGSFMGRAREACTLPFLIGASPVCYGVPTGIRRKKDL
ncbi:hypothetical protein FNV43_RR22238 [Rhamnella rubrinervis]|uniref:separase n=1 Tax=Rhamnella rubrinervis TaxID=2594499 RepID=A0A8K0DUT5_9ROSA|nr:hypothetical protein FNV43_RR22238 [Rhamnella rubrinervis]